MEMRSDRSRLEERKKRSTSLVFPFPVSLSSYDFVCLLSNLPYSLFVSLPLTPYLFLHGGRSQQGAVGFVAARSLRSLCQGHHLKRGTGCCLSLPWARGRWVAACKKGRDFRKRCHLDLNTLWRTLQADTEANKHPSMLSSYSLNRTFRIYCTAYDKDLRFYV